MEDLIARFMERYLPRKEIIHRLPLAVPITTFWPELQAARKAKSIELPLLDQQGKPFWFVINKAIERQCDAIAALARSNVAFSAELLDAADAAEAMIDEAVYSSMIEGAFTSREKAAAFIRKQKSPQNKAEQMVQNNYDALTFVLEHIDEPITERTILEIVRIVTRSAAEVEVQAYRTETVYVTGREGIVYAPPEANQVPMLMQSLVTFIADSELHPILKACIAHFYFVYVHPFGDGNGRTARALSLMMLLQAGYDFFRFFSISGIVAGERAQYYRAMLNVEEADSDMTYFIDCYSGMLAKAVALMEDHLKHHVLAQARMKQLKQEGFLNERQLKGAAWLFESAGDSVTVEAWRKKYKVVTETARKDLLSLCEAGVLVRTVEGRKAVFCIRWDE